MRQGLWGAKAPSKKGTGKKMKMTIREEYETMKVELRIWNKRSDWDDTNYVYRIEHHSKRAKTELLKMLNSDFEKMNFDLQYGFISAEKYNKHWKVWNDCSRSIANMSIY